MVDVDVATVAVVEVDEDVLGVEVWSGDGAGVQVAQLQPDTYRHISYRIDEHFSVLCHAAITLSA